MMASSALSWASSIRAGPQTRQVAARANPLAVAVPRISLAPCAPALCFSANRKVVCFASFEDAAEPPGNRLYVANLSYDTTAEGLGKHFAKAEGFVAADVAFDPRRQLSKGFGFVEFASPQAAQEAMQMLSETELDGRTLRLAPATQKPRNRDGDRGNRGFDRGDRNFERREPRQDRGYGDRGYDRGDRGYDRGDRGSFNRDRPPRRNQDLPPGVRIFVSNLPFSAEQEDLQDAFSEAGDIEFVDLLKKKLPDGRVVARGSAIIAFKSAEAAEQAIDMMDGQEFLGRDIRVRTFNDE